MGKSEDNIPRERETLNGTPAGWMTVEMSDSSDNSSDNNSDSENERKVF